MKLDMIATAGRLVLLAGAFATATALSLTSGPRGGHGWVFPARAQAQLVPAANGPTSFADIVERVKPAVIGVRVRTLDGRRHGGDLALPQPFPPAGRHAPVPLPRGALSALGSGFFVSADGYAVTNSHVIDGSSTIEVQTDDGKTHVAKVVGVDSVSDLALLKVDGRADFPFVNLAEKLPRVGDWVVAIGNPFGLGGSVTAGIVSARDRNIGVGSYEDMVQIDAPVNKGASGGPSFDLEGNVIGVNTMIFSPTGGFVGVAFAVPAATVRAVIPQLKEKGAVTRGWLGVQIQPVSDDVARGLGLERQAGALVVEVQPDGPAAKAGISLADVITAVNGETVNDERALVKKISATAPGTSVKLRVTRERAERSIAVVVGELPSKQRQATMPRPEPATSGRSSKSPLGLELVPAARVPGAGAHGVMVIRVDPNGSAADRGVAPGDVILEVDRKRVRTPDGVHLAMSKARKAGKGNVLMRLKSGGTLRIVAVPR